MAMSLPIRDVDKAFGDEDVFEGDIDLNGKCVSRDYHLKNKKYKNVILQNCKFKELIFEDCEFESLVIGYCSFKLLKLDKSRFDRDVDIQNCECTGILVLEDIEAKGNIDVGFTYGDIEIKAVNARYVSVYGDEAEGKIKKLLVWGNFRVSTIVLIGYGSNSKSAFESLVLRLQTISLRVKKVRAENLFLTGLVDDKCSIIFDYVESKSITIRELVAESSIIFRALKIVSSESKFEIDSSSLGKSRFAFCDFSKAGNFYLNNSFLDEIKSSGSRWPLKLGDEVSKNKEEDEVEVAVKRKASFSQIRNIMAASGERYHESQYRYLELDEQVKENIGLPDKVSLWVSKISSNHGANWVWALVVLLFVNLFLNGFMCLAHGGIRVMHESFLKNYFVILNPLYNSRDLFSGAAENEVVLSMLIFFSRVFTAYMYYQIVKSFRKYG